MRKGIIMDMDEGLLTVLTPDGEFLHATRLDRPYAIGEEISFFPIERTIQSKKPFLFFGLKSVLALSAALLVVFGSLFPMYQSNHAYAYMSIDVNPSIELGINKKMQVVELTGFNKEGKEIIAHLNNWKKQDVAKITKTIINEMEKEGYLKVKKQLVLSTVRTEEAEKQIEKQLEANIKEIKAAATEQQLELTVVSGTEQDLQKAHELGLTTGKYQTKSRNIKQHNEKSKGDSQPSVKVPPGHLKKQDNDNIGISNDIVEAAHQAGKQMPPGQQKKNEEQAEKLIPPGQQKKNEDQAEKLIPPGQQKKNEKQAEKLIPPGQQKKNEERPEKLNKGQLKKQLNQNFDSGHKKQPQNNNRKNRNQHK
ncbi:anti-sigma factor domain-containing protein [Neobacillus niacini]|uniref:anti-sigma factor domain-containing protein n=1 Tax=Neobacillus niacini TaxID=86668 RepID=UPI0021CB2FE4|nr:anti-sigma factor domain-containing protein [Neobacillus niacini]MCM3767439.1 anti-sigma factor domain-containing protein [Neobacillus niacini]